MPRFIAFLRAINVTGRRVKMAELRQLFETIGFTDVETFIASGNVIFSSRSRSPAAMERKIEEHLQDSLGHDVMTFLRTDSEVASISEYQPFTDSQMASATALIIGFLKGSASADQRQSLHEMKNDIDDFHVHGREVYWLCKKKQSESTFSNALFEKTLKIRSTFRTVKTLVRLAEKYPPSAGGGAGQKAPR